MLVDRVGGGEPLPEQLQPPGAHALWLSPVALAARRGPIRVAFDRIGLTPKAGVDVATRCRALLNPSGSKCMLRAPPAVSCRRFGLHRSVGSSSQVRAPPLPLPTDFVCFDH